MKKVQSILSNDARTQKSGMCSGFGVSLFWNNSIEEYFTPRYETIAHKSERVTIKRILNTEPCWISKWNSHWQDHMTICLAPSFVSLIS
jgi:hypothetical protein